MKLLSIAIPSYNSQDYLHHAVETLLSGGDDVEILIVDDGSKDGRRKSPMSLNAEIPASSARFTKRTAVTAMR